MKKENPRMDEIRTRIESLETLRCELGNALVDAKIAVLQEELRRIETGGGAYFEGAVHTAGDFVSGDKYVAPQIIKIVNQYAQAQPGVQPEELQRQVVEYLQWLQESFGAIVLRGIEVAGRQAVSLPLESVYVPLQAEYTEDEPSLDGEHPAAKRRLSQAQPAGGRAIHLNQVLGLGQRIILTGGPGCGKTTVLQHIAWALAAALNGGGEGLAQEKLGLAPPLPLPIYVPLSRYAAHLRSLPPSAPGREKSLANFVSEQYLQERQTHLSLSAGFLAYLLREGRDVLLLLDGLDEVPDETERARVRQAIEDLASGRQHLRLLVTSRTAAYQGQAVLGRGFRQVRVLPLAAPAIEQLARQAYASIYPHSPAQAQERAQDLLQGIQRMEAERRGRLGEDTPALVDSPLMVRLLLIVHFNERRLPDQRADLYRRAVDAMLSPDYALDNQVQRDIEGRIGGSLAASREMLQYLAFHMQRQGEQQGREIDEDALRRALCCEPTYAPHVADLIAQTRQRGTLLEERGGLYRFIHLSFQEFLAARYLAETLRDLEQIAQFFESGPALESWWREPALLAVGYLDITAPALARRLLLRLAGLDEAAAGRRLPADVQLAAAELAAVAYRECQNQASDLGERLQPRLRTLLDQEARPYPAPSRRAAVADALDRLGWLPGDLHRFVQIDNGAFWMGQYPVTNAQYERFLRAEDFADRELWLNFPQFSEPDERGKIKELGDWGEAGRKWLQGALKDKEISSDGRRVSPRYWDDPRFSIARRGAPVVGITWYEANAYCKWLLRHWAELEEGRANPELRPQIVRLPTDAEWALAAGGAQPEDRFPWDVPGEITREQEEILRRANVRESEIGRTTPVGMYPLGISQPYGLHDLAGNVWEWQANYYDKDRDWLALRGGSWDFNEWLARLPVRNFSYPNSRNYGFGLRLAALPNEPL